MFLYIILSSAKSRNVDRVLKVFMKVIYVYKNLGHFITGSPRPFRNVVMDSISLWESKTDTKVEK